MFLFLQESSSPNLQTDGVQCVVYRKLASHKLKMTHERKYSIQLLFNELRTVMHGGG